MSLSGDQALIGAFWDEDLGTRSGSAYVYDNLSALPTAVEMIVDFPQGYLLSAPYPNPFNPATTIRYAVPTPGPVHLDVFDVLGRRVAGVMLPREAVGASPSALADAVEALLP